MALASFEFGTVRSKRFHYYFDFGTVRSKGLQYIKLAAMKLEQSIVIPRDFKLLQYKAFNRKELGLTARICTDMQVGLALYW
jgi:hypothetical protein